MWLRQIAQLSTTMSQAQSATAFHYCMLERHVVSGSRVTPTNLLDFEAFLATVCRTSFGLGALDFCAGGGRCIGHVNVGHFVYIADASKGYGGGR